MDSTLEALCDSLDELAGKVIAAWADDRPVREVHGWNHASLTRQELAAISAGLAQRIRNSVSESVPPTHRATIADFPRRLKMLHADTVPHMFNGNGQLAIPAYMETLYGLERLLGPVIGWVPNPENQMMPAPMARRLRAYQNTIDALAPNAEQLKVQIAQIHEATEAAEHLPTDLHDLAEAKKKIDKFASDAATLYGKLDERGAEVAQMVINITAKELEAVKLVDQCEQAYRITTTKGLAAAFDQRAWKIAFSMWVWVFGLLCALVAATYLGLERMKMLSIAMAGENPQWGIVWMQAALSFLSVGAPLWFGWVATKQLAQRFRLAEDYGFKASVAKAYEGYRREAARLDPALEARLFASALTRLEEAPLRLLADEKDHGSPGHALINSRAFEEAVKLVPDFKSQVLDLAEKALAAVRPTGKPAVAVPPQAPN